MAFNYDDPDLGFDEDEDEDMDGLPDEYSYDEDDDFDDFDDFDDEEDDEQNEDDEEENDFEDTDQDDYDDYNDLEDEPDTSSSEGGENVDDFTSKNTTSSGKTNKGSTNVGANGVGSTGATSTGVNASGASVASAGTTSGTVAGGFATGGATSGAAAGAATSGGATAGLAICWPIVIAVLVVLLILIISAAVTVATENADEENGTITYQTITDENFYGVRTIYIDDTELATQLQKSYKDYCLDIFNILKENSAINLTLNTDNLDDTTSLVLNNLSIGIGNIISTGNSDFNEIEFASLYSNIQYFGISNDKLPTVNEFICNYLISNNLATSNTSQSIEELINLAFQDNRLEYIKNQCEKIMIKDISAGENGFGTIKTNLKSIIYLPKKQVTLSNLQYNIRVNNDDDTVNMKIISNNGSTDTVLQEETIDISWNENFCYSEFNEDLELTIGQYGNVGSTENPLYLEGVSLFTLLKNGSNLPQKDGIYTWTPTEKCIYLLFESTNSFTINEFYISVE